MPNQNTQPAASAGQHKKDRTLDAAIVGGGIAGTWLLNLLTGRGYDAVLFEADAIGCQQTLGSQGMIHGGVKYALGGRLTDASEAIADMPQRWRSCLAGRGDVDLTGLTPLSEHYYLFADGGSLGRLATFFASRMLRGRIERLDATECPPALEPLDGVVYRLGDFVMHVPALLERLTLPVASRIFRHRIEADRLARSGSGWRIALADRTLMARRLILTGGAGNGPLIEGLGLGRPAMQLRPLHQVMVRHPELPPLYAHCLTGTSRAEPRLTITSHRTGGAGDAWLWYLGGQLATDGVARDPGAQIEHARRELGRCVPWIDWTGASFETCRWDRAEPAREARRRPDQASVTEAEDCLVCWPTKLTLAPDLGDRVLALLPPPATGAAGTGPELNLPQAAIGGLPWEQ